MGQHKYNLYLPAFYSEPAMAAASFDLALNYLIRFAKNQNPDFEIYTEVGNNSGLFFFYST